jgi:hypothetical protein
MNLVHHAQNCRGELDDLSTDAHYAKDGKGREIEAEAYLLGNGFLVRDYEDSIKFEGVNEMKSIKEQNELGDILDKLYDGPRDKNKIPLEKPPLKKDWKKDPIGRKQRSDFRKWYTTYGPGSKKKDPSNAMGGMTSPEGPATDDPSLDYQTKAPQTPPASGMRRAMSRKEYKRFYGESPETTQKLLADDDYRKLVGMAVVNKMKKRLKQLDPNAFRKGTGDEFDDSFSTNPFYQSREKPPRRSVIDENKGVNKMKLTKSQLKGLIEQTVKNLISEKDADGDGSPAPPKWADPDDNDPKVKASMQKEQDGELEEQEEVEEGTQPPEEKKDGKTAKFLDDMIKKKLRKKVHSPKSPAELVPLPQQPVQPVSPIKLEESNDTWYNSSLYESLRTKWAKKGDK